MTLMVNGLVSASSAAAATEATEAAFSFGAAWCTSIFVRNTLMHFWFNFIVVCEPGLINTAYVKSALSLDCQP